MASHVSRVDSLWRNMDLLVGDNTVERCNTASFSGEASPHQVVEIGGISVADLNQ